MAIETTSDLSLVGTSQIVDGSVTSAKIAAGAVVSAAIAAASVGTAAISSGAATSGQVLQANGSGAVTFATPAAGGGMTLIATATPSAATSLSFTSIPGTYKHLVIMFSDVTQSAAGQWNIRCNNDTTASYHYLWIRDGVVTGTTFGDTQDIFACISNSTSTFPINRPSGFFTFWRYTESQIKLMTGIRSSISASARVSEVVGNYLGTSAITQIDFIRSSTQTITGNFYLYGVS
jgi:hypothetical protein